MRVSGNEIVFQVTFTPEKPAKYLIGSKLQQFISQRKFYTCNQPEDYLDYTSRGATKDILAYAGNEKKSCGIFGQQGELSGKELIKVRNELRKTQSIIWHGFVSFEAEFGNKHCNNVQSAMTFMKHNFVSKFLSKTHLNADNITWLASLHEDTDNYHIHFMFFEKEPKRYRDKSGEPQYSGKGNIKKEILNNAKAEFYGYFLTKTCSIHHLRDKMLSEIRRKYYSEHGAIDNGLLRELKELSAKLPKEGSLKYGSSNMAFLRFEIDSLSLRVIKGDKSLRKRYRNFCSLLLNRDNNIKTYGEKSGTDTHNLLNGEKIKNDLFVRMGNQIIDSALYLSKIRNKPMDGLKPRFIAKSLLRKRKNSVLREYAYLLHRINNTAMDIFDEYLKTLARIEAEQLTDIYQNTDRG